MAKNLPSWDETAPASEEAIPAPAAVSSAPSWEDTVPAPAQESEKAELPNWEDTAPAVTAAPTVPATEEKKPAPYKSVEEYPGQHEDLKRINAISLKEVKEIAQKNGVPWEDLRSIAPYYRVGVEEQAGQGTPITDDMKKAVGYLSSAGMDLPLFVAKKASSPEMRAAMDDLASLAETRKSGVVRAGEMASGLLLPVGQIGEGAVLAAKAAAKMPSLLEAAGTIGKEVGKQAAVGAGFGAAAGLGASREGEELEKAGKGALFGGAVGGALGAVVGTFKVGGQVGKALGVRGEEEAALLQKTEEKMATPEVAEQVAAGEDRVSRIATEGEAPSATIILEKKSVAREVERLKQDPEYMQKIADANPDLVEYMERGAGRQLSEEEMYLLLAKRQHANQAEGELIEFARYLKNPTGKLPATSEELIGMTKPTSLRRAGEKIREWTSQGRDETFLRQEYRNWKAVQTATDLNLDKVAREVGITSSELTRQVRKYFRVRGQFKIIDNRSGTALEPLADSFVQADNLKNKAINQAISEARPVLDASSRTGLREIGIQELEAIERTGDLSKLSEEQRPVLQEFSKLFEKARQNVGKLGVNIQEIAAEKARIYIPRMQVDAATTTGRIRDRIRSIEEASGIPFQSHFDVQDMDRMRANAPVAFKELAQTFTYMTGKELRTPAELSKFVSSARTVDGTARLMSAKSSRKALSLAKARAEVGIPSFLRETDLNKLYVRWNADALKQAYWRNSLQELTKQRGLLAAGGDRAGVEYVDWYLKKLSGGEQGLARWATQTRNELSAALTSGIEAAERSGNRKAAALLNVLHSGLDLPSILTGTMYGNIFALNPKAFVQNLVQPLVTTLPELSLGGNGWASAKVLKGYFETLKELRNPLQLSRMLEERGYIAPHFSDEMSGAFRTGVEKGAVSRMSRSALDKLTTYGMVLMQTSETVNRVATLKMAESVAEDLMRGSKSAEAFLNGVGKGYKYEFGKLVQAKDLPALQKKMADYLIAKTMFHYSPLMASQLGSYLGRIGTAFSTWPTTITADVVADFANKSQMGGRYLLVKKYMAPLAALLAVDHVAKGLHVGPDESPRAKALVGKQGLAGGAPIRSMTDIATRGVLSSPYVEEAFKGFAAAASGDAGGWWKATKGMGSLIVPGAGYYHALNVTVPRLFLNKEPEK